jgi:ABC-type transport system involved in multi-copper enzyme maturation permease subunit
VFRALFAKEILEALAGRRFWTILALCLVLVPLGVEVSLRDYQTRLHNYQEAVRIYREETKTVVDILYKEGAKAFAPPSPLSFLSLGLELVLPRVAESQYKIGEGAASLRLSNNQGRDNLYEYFYGPLDIVFIVGVIMSFLAIVLTYGAVAGEKEQGTLRQVLANSVPRATVVLAKGTANFLVLAVPFLLAVGASLVIIEGQAGTLSSTAGAGTSLLLALAFSLLFIGAFFNLGLLVSALTRQAVTALIVLLLSWVFLYGVYPRLAVAAAQILRPAKSEARLALERVQIQRDVNKECEAEVDKLLETMPADTESAAFKAGMEKQAEIRGRFQVVFQDRWRTVEREAEERRNSQIALAAGVARLSPVSLFVRPLAELAGTGWLGYVRFNSQVRQFESIVNRDIFLKQTYTRYPARGGRRGGIGISNNADDSATAPAFAYVPGNGGEVVRDVLPDLAILAVVNLLLFAGAFVAFLRYDAR